MVDRSSVALAALLAVGLPLLVCLASLGYVEQNEYGLVYNWVTKSIGDKAYHGGTHLIGFWNAFIIFPATVQTIEFSDRLQSLSTSGMLHTRTKEGLGLHLSIAFQYRLDAARLPELYALTNLKYEGLFVRIARDQLLEAASEYEGPEYWLRRHDIGAHMRRLVDRQLRASHASVWGLQLLVIDLPDGYEHAITMTQVQQQMIKTRRNEQAAASIRADTEILRAEFARKIKVVEAGAQANYTTQTKIAEAEAEGRKLAAEADALGYVRQRLGLTESEAVRYQELSAYAAMQNATFLADIPGPQAMLGVGSVLPAAASFLQRAGRKLRASTARTNRSEGPFWGPQALEPEIRGLQVSVPYPRVSFLARVRRQR
uniref:Band 7 domain-containing protein n=1 Tax=Alexandrium monilatum TaxID=311494 RepID=A0A7S4Q981_9DINO|mmetsp:Transcript_104602/g.312437  ORF Transcript_104602/g.312437 Transcript_104602/m.312437 type:complete len:372 (+) Transcript_104602:66-1181(+)